MGYVLLILLAGIIGVVTSFIGIIRDVRELKEADAYCAAIQIENQGWQEGVQGIMQRVRRYRGSRDRGHFVPITMPYDDAWGYNYKIK